MHLRAVSSVAAGAQDENEPEEAAHGPPQPVSGEDVGEPEVLIQEFSVSEQPAQLLLAPQPQDHAEHSMQSEEHVHEQPDVDEGADVQREMSIAADGVVFGHNFLPPFANAENRALNSEIKVRIAHIKSCTDFYMMQGY